MSDTSNFEIIKIGLASPEQIAKWSKGEVKKPETINYRTLKPEKDGLFCEKIFGPTKDWECYCGKYKKVRFKGIICERCGVEITKSKVRRERMGHIQLAAPISHIWYFKGVPSRLGYLLDITPRDLEKILYFAANIVISVDKDKRQEALPAFEAELIADLEHLKVEYENNLSMEKQQYDRKLALLNMEREADENEEPREKKATKAELKKAEKLYQDTLNRYEARYEDQKNHMQAVFNTFKNLKDRQIVDEEKVYKDLRYGYSEFFKGGAGAEAIKELLKGIDLVKEEKVLRGVIKKAKGQKRNRAVKRLKVVSAFLRSNNKPEWMILDIIPVIPPDLRPMVQLDGGRFATSDLNDLYRRVINRNNRLKRLLDLFAPEIIVNNEKRMLQEAVDALLDNGRRGRPVTGPNNRPLKSLSDMLKGKQGRFRQNLLGKRVDYSGRSVIVVGPNLKLHQCGLPKVMALELFKPFVMHLLVAHDLANNIKSARKLIERGRPEVWDVLEEAIKEHPVMLNRAPTLHRLGIQAFEPVLVEGKAIQVHPLVCSGFNADFDGDQMAVHLPLSAEAQVEARLMMLSVNNILSPAHGRPVTIPSQDMILGIYNLTMSIPGAMGEGMKFSNPDEAIIAHDCGVLDLQAEVDVRINKKLVKTTVGRIIFNQVLPQKVFTYKNKTFGKKDLSAIVEKCADQLDRAETAEFLDSIKDLGFKYASKSGISIGVDDIVIPDNKWELLIEPEKQVEKFEEMYRKGLITDQERHQRVIETWNQATEDIGSAMEEKFKEQGYNPVYIMANSGARGDLRQLRQLAGMRGLMSNPKGEVIERPIKANFREGLTVIEYFISSHGARKGLADTALRTADSGYLTRRLVDVSQDVIVREHDCGTTKGISMIVFGEDGDVNRNLKGRSLAEDIKDENNEVLAKRNEQINDKTMKKLEKTELKTLTVRSTVHCEAKYGICQQCYGWSLADGHIVEIGEASGIIAAQSIGEPGTQLTMRTFHMGGVAGDDITHGLPRIQELFEARKPKGQGIIAEIGGMIQIIANEEDKNRSILIKGKAGKEKAYAISRRSKLLVSDGDDVEAGRQLTEGSIDPHEILMIKGTDAVQKYIVREVQEVYRSQGVDIDDRHIELIVRQMTKKVQISESGDSELLPGQVVDRLQLEAENARVLKLGGEPAEGSSILLGITKASLNTDSFLSAASFQETTRVLTEAAIASKVDPLLGLKENVIIGKLIPAATGLLANRNIKVIVDGEEVNEEDLLAKAEETAELEYASDLQADAEAFGISTEEFTRARMGSAGSPDAGIKGAESFELDEISDDDELLDIGFQIVETAEDNGAGSE